MLFFISLLALTGIILPWKPVATQSIPSSSSPLSSLSSSSSTKIILPLSISENNFTLFNWSPPLRMNANTAGDMMANQIFDFDLEKEAILQLIDYKKPGERFQLFDQGRSLGKTTEPNLTDESVIYEDSPDLAMIDKEGRFSKGQVLLKPGHHSISIKILTGATPDHSGAALRLIDPPSFKLQQFQRKFEGENDDYYDYDDVAITTITVVVPPSIQDQWNHGHKGGKGPYKVNPPVGHPNLQRNPRAGMRLAIA